MSRLIETAIAIGLLLGLARRLTYFGGALFSLLIWSTAEGFGGPYTLGATNIGPALVYALVFLTAAFFEHFLGPNPYSLDYYLGRLFPKWAALVEWAPKRSMQPPPALNWDQQLGVIGGVFVILVFALATLGSARTSLPPTPQNAAAAVSPLQLAAAPVSPLSMTTAGPTTKRSLPVLPPLISNGAEVNINLVATDTTIETPTASNHCRSAQAAASGRRQLRSGARRMVHPAGGRQAHDRRL